MCRRNHAQSTPLKGLSCVPSLPSPSSFPLLPPHSTTISLYRVSSLHLLTSTYLPPPCPLLYLHYLSPSSLIPLTHTSLPYLPPLYPSPLLSVIQCPCVQPPPVTSPGCAATLHGLPLTTPDLITSPRLTQSRYLLTKTRLRRVSANFTLSVAKRRRRRRRKSGGGAGKG